MAYFKRIELLGDLGELKINLDNIISVGCLLADVYFS